MPLPALAGIPWLASVLGALFIGLIGFFAKYLTKRLALVAAAIVAIGALTTGFFAAMNAIISNLGLIVPDGVAAFIGHVIPTNFMLTVSALLSAHVIRWAYEWNVKIIQLKLF